MSTNTKYSDCINIENYIISKEKTILEVMKVINHNGKGIVFVCQNKVLLGVITDGDIRRYILKQGDLNNSVETIANRKPYYLIKGSNINPKDFITEKKINAVPILNNKKEILSIYFLNYMIEEKKEKIDIPVVIMAGGEGTRLYPYTKILPKPLIPIGEKTITEIIMDHFEAYGCTHFDLIINYKKNLIKSFFLDNEEKRNITFIEEDEFLGTGGGLRYLKGKYNSSFFITNCDIIVQENYSKILKYHKESQNILTIVAATKKMTIPYGTIEVNQNGTIKTFKEKPSFSLLTNAGLYIAESTFLDKIPNNIFIHMTEIIQKCLKENEKIGVYPISEDAWFDMGQFSEMEQMKKKLNID